MPDSEAAATLATQSRGKMSTYDVLGCFLGGAVGALLLALAPLAIGIWNSVGSNELAGAILMAIVTLLGNGIKGGVRGLLFLIPVLKGRPYLKALALAAIFALIGLIASYHDQKDLDVATVLVAGGLLLATFATWSFLAAFLLHKIFKARV